jgi:tetraacyldisaccharide 4'-kinase
VTKIDLFHRRLVCGGGEGFLEKLLLLLLQPFGLLYGMIGVIRAFLYRKGVFTTYHAGVPVVSVGNLAAGGTGKTPVVDHLLQHFLTRGKRVAVVSRGYGGRISSGVGIVCQGEGPVLSAEECGDEPYLLARRNPRALVLVARRRAEGVAVAEKELGAEVIVLDDGFQHLGVARDLDLVLLDARFPLGNGRVLPAGILREFPSALARADLFLLTRSVAASDWQPPFPRPILTCRHLLGEKAVALSGESVPVADLLGKPALAFAGIADPQDFFSALVARGINLAAAVPLSDHARYDADFFGNLLANRPQIDFLVTTEKDGVKLRAEDIPLPCYQIPLVLAFSENGGLEEFLKIDGYRDVKNS